MDINININYFHLFKDLKRIFFYINMSVQISNSNIIEILKEYKNSLISFFDELIDQFPEEGDLIIVRIFLKDQMPIETVINIFINNLNKDDQKLRKMVKDRNEIFFLENNIFDTVNKDKVLHFKKLWRSGRLDDDDKKVVWRWIDSFIFLSDKYIKEKTIGINQF